MTPTPFHIALFPLMKVAVDHHINLKVVESVLVPPHLLFVPQLVRYVSEIASLTLQIEDWAVVVPTMQVRISAQTLANVCPIHQLELGQQHKILPLLHAHVVYMVVKIVPD